MSYLEPPPMPAPVVVRKDVGGYVGDYEAQTAIYRMTGREVRLHECRSACTLALGLPNVCVYPDSILKFHQAYDPRNRQTNEAVSRQLFDSYPAAVRARLGSLTRSYQVLRGSELISLGIRNCSDKKTLVATAAEPRKVASDRRRAGGPSPDGSSVFDGLVEGVMAVFGQSSDPASGIARSTAPTAMAKAASVTTKNAAVPVPPTRPPALGTVPGTAPADEVTTASEVTHTTAVADAAVPAPPPRPGWSTEPAPVSVTTVLLIAGAQAILPARFATFAAVR